MLDDGDWNQSVYIPQQWPTVQKIVHVKNLVLLHVKLNACNYRGNTCASLPKHVFTRCMPGLYRAGMFILGLVHAYECSGAQVVSLRVHEIRLKEVL